MAHDPRIKVTVDTASAQASLNKLGASFAGASQHANQAGESAKLIGGRLSETIKSFIAFEFAKKIVQTADATMRATDSMVGLSAATRDNAKSYVANTKAAKESMDRIILSTSGFMSTLADYAAEGLGYWAQVFGADPEQNQRVLQDLQYKMASAKALVDANNKDLAKLAEKRLNSETQAERDAIDAQLEAMENRMQNNLAMQVSYQKQMAEQTKTIVQDAAAEMDAKDKKNEEQLVSLKRSLMSERVALKDKLDADMASIAFSDSHKALLRRKYNKDIAEIDAKESRDAKSRREKEEKEREAEEKLRISRARASKKAAYDFDKMDTAIYAEASGSDLAKALVGINADAKEATDQYRGVWAAQVEATLDEMGRLPEAAKGDADAVLKVWEEMMSEWQSVVDPDAMGFLDTTNALMGDLEFKMEEFQAGLDQIQKSHQKERDKAIDDDTKVRAEKRAYALSSEREREIAEIRKTQKAKEEELRKLYDKDPEAKQLGITQTPLTKVLGSRTSAESEWAGLGLKMSLRPRPTPQPVMTSVSKTEQEYQSAVLLLDKETKEKLAETTDRYLQEDIDKHMAHREAMASLSSSVLEDLEIEYDRKKAIAEKDMKDTEQREEYLAALKKKYLRDVSDEQRRNVEEIASATAGLFGSISQLIATGDMKDKQRRLAYKGAAKSEIAINTAVGISKAYALGGPLGLITGAGVAIAGLAQERAVDAQKFATGGIAKGPTSGDQVPVRVNGGEMILTQAQQGELFKMANGGGGGGITVHYAPVITGSNSVDMRRMLQENHAEFARYVKTVIADPSLSRQQRAL